MSEVINNIDRRKELLKMILKGLHEGQPLEVVRQRFSDLVQIADSGEIAEAEQMLMAEGIPAVEIQNLCDLHVSVFREALDQNQISESIPGHPLFTFKAENQAAVQMLQTLHQLVDTYANQPQEVNRQAVKNTLTQLCSFEKHYLRKENLLFPILERYGFSGPSQVMWGIHDQIRVGLKNMTAVLETNAPGREADYVSKVKEAFDSFEIPLREMIYKEENILFPAALERLNEEDWYAIRCQEKELGYFMVEESGQWKPTRQIILEEESGAIEAKPAQPVNEGGLIGLDTGGLNPEQINLLLTHLPVDVTFVDENDEVRFFSQSKERIFARQAAIIGRKVQNCHPPKSLDKVQHILDDFRSGKRNEAEFWIEMMGKFIHIRYYAMHDAHGQYRGTLEVSQDVTGIRSLKGERRLLDD